MHKGALGFFAFYTRFAMFWKFILVLGLNFLYLILFTAH